MTTRGEQTRARLLQATTSVVSELGYVRATTRAIAASAGVAEGTIYRHFPDKRALFVAAVLERHQALTEWMRGLPAQAGVRPLDVTLTECLVRLSELRESIVPLELALINDPEAAGMPGAPDALARGVREMGGPPALLAEYLAAEQELGRIRPEHDPGEIAVVLLTVLFGLAAGPLPVDSGVLAGAVRLLLVGIAS